MEGTHRYLNISTCGGIHLGLWRDKQTKEFETKLLQLAFLFVGCPAARNLFSSSLFSSCLALPLACLLTDRQLEIECDTKKLVSVFIIVCIAVAIAVRSSIMSRVVVVRATGLCSCLDGLGMSEKISIHDPRICYHYLKAALRPLQQPDLVVGLPLWIVGRWRVRVV